MATAPLSVTMTMWLLCEIQLKRIVGADVDGSIK